VNDFITLLQHTTAYKVSKIDETTLSSTTSAGKGV